MKELPLVSFCITCHNQSAYIRQALESALNQSYSNVEVVISDNASSDGSQTMIASLVEEFSRKYPGKRIVPNFNKVDIGCIRNFEKCFSLAKGEIFIEADGDDISLPDRASEIVAAWENSNRKATVFLHQWIAFDEKYEYSPIKIKSVTADVRGAAMAYSRQVYDAYNRISQPGANPDAVWTYRALHLKNGCGSIINKPLIKYRLGGMTTCRPYAKSYVNVAIFTLNAVRQLRLDFDSGENELLVIDKWASNRLDMINGGAFHKRLRGFCALHNNFRLTRSVLLDAMYLLPRSIGWMMASVLEDVFYPHRIHGRVISKKNKI